jgi:hypothetical protein
MIIIPINEEIRQKCRTCPAKFMIPKSYYPGMDLSTCDKVESCPCDFNPKEYFGCIYME